MKRTLLTLTIASLLATTAFADPIHTAAKAGDLAAVQAELDAGVDVDLKGSYGRTPLHQAALGGHKEVAELLIAEGADVNAKNNGDLTPLDWAINKNHTEIAAVLRKHGGKTGEELKTAEPVAEAATSEPPTVKAPDISIHKAARTGNIEAVKQHLAAGADVDVKGAFGTPLHYAMMYRPRDVDALLEVVELLIAAGTDVNVKNRGGQVPLHQAAMRGYKEIVELLLAKGADVNAKGWDGRTPVDYAIRKEEIADLLRKHGGKTGEELKAEGK